VQNICQPAQASDNFNSFRQLEDFDHKTMKQGWEKNYPKMGILLLLMRKKLHIDRDDGAVWRADRFGG
jgi:hypothetical protein